MHRTNRVPHALTGTLLALGLLLGGGLSLAVAQADKVDKADKGDKGEVAKPALRTVDVAVNATKPLQMTSKLKIVGVTNDKDAIVAVRGSPTDPTTLNLTGLTPGKARLTLTSEPDPKTNLPVVEEVDVIVQLDVELLRTLLKQAVPTASVVPIPGAGNTIILTGTVAHSEDIQTILGIANSITSGGTGPGSIINAMRVGGVMQVQLDVVVALVARQEIRRMAVDLFDVGQHHIYTSVPGGSINVPAPGSGITGTLPGGPFTVQNIVGTPNGVPFNTFLSIFNGRQSLFLFLQALRTNDLAKVLAEPHLVTLSGRPATFLSGGEQAVPEVGGFGGVAGTRFEPFGTRLQFLPIVLGNGKIYMEVEPEVSQLSATNGSIIGGALVQGRVIQRVRTSVMMEDGQTFAVGGLIQTEVTGDSVRVPVVGDIPFLGTLFGSKSYNDRETELVILVTPHLVDAMSCDQVPKYLPGQETRKPDDFELFLENILEAPRGSRAVNHGNRYVPAWKNGPSAAVYPCISSAKGNDGHGGQGVPIPPESLMQPGPVPPLPGNVMVQEPAAPPPPTIVQPGAQPTIVQPVSASEDNMPLTPAVNVGREGGR